VNEFLDSVPIAVNNRGRYHILATSWQLVTPCSFKENIDNAHFKTNSWCGAIGDSFIGSLAGPVGL